MARRPPVATRLREQAARVADTEVAETLDEGAAEIELLRAQLAGVGVLAIGAPERLTAPTIEPDEPDEIEPPPL